MITRPWPDIGPGDVQTLLDDQVRESRTLDYKEALPHEKVGLLKDVAALANTDGGDILFGVREKRENGKTTGLPEAVVGLPGLVLDQEARRLDDIIRSGLKPRLTGVRFKQIDCPEGPVLLMRVEPGFAGPHMVTHDENRFWGRGGMSNYVLDADELRRLFLRTADLPSRVRRLRDERLGLIAGGDTPFALSPKPKVVLHLVPLRAFDPAASVDVQKVGGHPALFPPLDAGGWDGRYNLDGYATFRKETAGVSLGYAQLFRNGVIEAVDANLLGAGGSERTNMPADYLVETLLNAVRAYLRLLDTLDSSGPYSVLVNLLGVKGYIISDTNRWVVDVIDRDRVLLPETFLPDQPSSLTDAMRPMFDALWQASGWKCWPGYDAAKARFG